MTLERLRRELELEPDVARQSRAVGQRAPIASYEDGLLVFADWEDRFSGLSGIDSLFRDCGHIGESRSFDACCSEIERI